MQELEVKILEINKDMLISKLERLGAQKIFDSQIVANFYINNEGKRIRLRKYGNKNILTYKENIKKQDFMENIEYEIAFDNYSNMENILKLIGFNKYGNSSKHRISYKLGDIRFDFDKYENIPWFVEVESNNKDDVIKGVEILGYSMTDCKTMTEKQLKEYYLI